MNTVPITELAAVIRSKNAGPYELTVDILFKDELDYLWLKKVNFFTGELFADLYGISVSKVINMVWFDAAFAVKCTMVRSTVSGAPGDTDIYGAQQHAPLLNLRVPMREA
jgi:hypothetical protein